jgi:hypothetical protein
MNRAHGWESENQEMTGDGRADRRHAPPTLPADRCPGATVTTDHVRYYR